MSAEDYSWFSKTGLGYGYCFTLVKGVDRAEALRRLGSEDHRIIDGMAQFREADGCVEPGTRRFRFYVGAANLDGWTLLVEAPGFLGVSPQGYLPLSAGTELVSHYRNVDAEDRFCWVRDGELRLSFEPLFPCWRSGTEPDGLLDVMADLGYDLRDQEDRDFELHTEATFALAEHLTGVRITAELLDNAEYLCAGIPLKR